ncbi:MAG: hypothetical protein LBV07_02140 [Syntrophobacterales bacterium]|jgi:hypothetical protein|nr:hypothetical protein [Syntrophobacterales bacterium]
MEIILQILNPAIRKKVGWKEGKSQEICHVTGNTLGDLLKTVMDAQGKSFWERFMERDGAISQTYVFIGGDIFYLHEKDLARPLVHGQKVALLGQLVFCGGG